MIRLTPLFQGRNGLGSVCSLLEIGGAIILLDCGAPIRLGPGQCSEDYQIIKAVRDNLISIGGVDAVLISHADMQHMSALPIICGTKGINATPVFATLPVFKFGQLVLYDFLQNMRMEGADIHDIFSFDDIDAAFQNTVTVKYNQRITLHEKTTNIQGTSKSGKAFSLSISAIPSGRTIGGTVWKIRSGSAEVLYAMDANLRKETLLDGMNLESLPIGCSLLIVNSPFSGATLAAASSSIRKKKEKEDSGAALIASCMETLRAGGNVLIPCETAGRMLELLQLFAKHWMDNKLGLYHLMYLSHMARNVPEFAKMQLEWMSDSLARGFYNGKPNPFELPQVKFLTSTRDIERKYIGPKLVLASDASLSFGLSKELLLKWGGDPRCKVIFTDSHAWDESSLSAELCAKSMTPPIIATVVKPVKVELVGDELIEFKKEAERQKKIRDEASQRKRRQEELMQLNIGKDAIHDDEVDDDSDDENVESMKRNEKAESDVVQQKKRLKSNVISKFLERNFVMFESNEVSYKVDEFGRSNDDLQFHDILSMEARMYAKDGKGSETTLAPIRASVATTASSMADMSITESTILKEEALLPLKTVSVPMRVQFTCEFKEISGISGRADIKAMKAITAKVNPARLIILRGCISPTQASTALTADCEALMQFASSNGIEVYAPRNRSSVSFQVQMNKLQMIIPQSLLPETVTNLKQFSTNSLMLQETKSNVTALLGSFQLKAVATTANTDLSEAKVVKYLGLQKAEDESQDHHGDEGEEDKYRVDKKALQVTPADVGTGAVSVVEVTLNSIRQLLEANGMAVDFRLGVDGGMLICKEQVVIRKEGHNDFIIEGPPIPTYFETRKLLYQQFGFV